MSQSIPFRGADGHPFMEFLKGPGDCCWAQHDFFEWTVGNHQCSPTKGP